jgi:hypothetical protein
MVTSKLTSTGRGVITEPPAPPPPPVGSEVIAVGITSDDARDGSELPIAFVATTVNVYAVPFVSPEIVIGEEVPVAVCPPDDVTV